MTNHDERTASRCESCGATIFWAKTRYGRRIPIDYEPVADGNLRLEDGIAHYVTQAEQSAQSDLFGRSVRYVTHFATCPDASEHRRPR